MIEPTWNPMSQQFEQPKPTLVDFLLARIAEDEAQADESWGDGTTGPGTWHAWVLAECEAKRRIIEWHKAWPVLIETPPTFDQPSGGDPSSVTFSMSKQIMWATEQEYRNRFGTEPPTGPVLRLLALPYADHPDYRPEWAPDTP